MSSGSAEEETPVASASSAIPADSIMVRLLLTSGQSHDFLLKPDSDGIPAQVPQSTVKHLRELVYAQWPSSWKQDASVQHVAGADQLRILYRGRFLEDTVTMEALKLPLGQTTTMHLVPKPTPQQLKRDESGGCRCICC